MGFWDHYDEMGPLPSRGAERGHLFRELFERGSSRDFEYYGVSKNAPSGNYKGWSQHMAEGRASSYVNTSSNYWAKPYYPPPRATLGGMSVGSQSMANSFTSMNVEGQLGLPGFNTNTNQFGSIPQAAVGRQGWLPPTPKAPTNWGGILRSPTLGGAVGGLAYGASIIARMGADPGMVPNVIFPGAIVGGISQALQTKAMAPFLSNLGKEGILGFSRVGEGAAARTFFNAGRAQFALPGIGQTIGYFDLLNSVRQAGSTDPTMAAAGRNSLGYAAGFVATSTMAAPFVGAGLAATAIGMGGSAVVGYGMSQMLENSTAQNRTLSSIKALSDSQQEFSKVGFGANTRSVAPKLPKNLSSIQTAATAASLYLDTFMAGTPMIYGLAKSLGAPTSQDIRDEFKIMSLDAKNGTGQFKGTGWAEAKAGYISAALAPNVLVPGGTSTYADAIDYKGGLPGFVNDELGGMYKEGKELRLSDSQIGAATSGAAAMAYASLNQRAQHEGRIIQNMRAAAGKGLFGQAHQFTHAEAGIKNPTALQKSALGALNAVNTGLVNFGNWATSGISSLFAQPAINAKIDEQRKTIAARNTAGTYLTGRGGTVPSQIANGSPDFLRRNLAALAGSVGRTGGGGGGYDNSWQIKAEARYQQSQREQAVKERSYQAQADNRLALARIPDVVAPHVNSWDMKRGVSHPGASGGLAQSLMELRANSELGSQELSTYISELGVKKAATEKQQAAVMANPALNKQGKTEELTRTTEELSRLNAQIAIATKNQTQHNRVLEISTKEYKDQAAFLTKQNAENLNRTNYQQNRDIFNQRSATLLNKKTNGLISGRNFLAQSFDLNKGFLESQIKEMNDGLDQDSREFATSKANFATSTGQAYDPNGTYAPGTEGYDLQQTERALQTRRSNIGIYENELKTTFSASARRFQDRRSLSAAIEKGISPYTSQFFGSLGRGNSFGDSIKALQLPFMQQIGQLASRGISSGLAGLFQDFTLKSAAGGSPSGQAFDITSELLPATDGDSLKLKDGTQIRIAGIDAPEKNQAGGLEAAVGLQAILKKAKSVAFQQTGLSYGRSVGTVTVDGKDLGKMMASSGLAQPSFGKYGEFASKFRFSDPKLHRMANQAAGVLAGGESFPDGLVDNFTAAATADASSIPYFGQIYSGNSIQSYFQKNSELVGLPVIGGTVGGGAASPIGNFQSFANAPVRGGGAGSAVGSLGSTGVLAGIGAAFKSTGGITGMVSRFFGKSGTTSIASTLAAKGGTIGKLAGNFAKNGGMGFGSLAAFGNLLGGAVGSIGGAYVGKMIASEHYGNTGGTVGSTVGGIAGSIIGTALGGPVGAVIGGFLGSLLGGGIGGFFGGGSGKKAAKEQQAAQELHQKTMSVFVPKIKGIMGDIDPLDWDSVEGAKNRLRATPVRGREQTSIRRAAYNDIAAIKKALLPYKDLSDRPGGIAGNLFENRVRGEIAQNAYGAFSSAPTRELYGLYSQIQSQLSELKPDVRGTYKTLSQEALTSQYNYQNQALNLQISRGNTNYGFDVRGAEIASRDRAIGYDQAQHNLGNFDRDTQRSLEQVMGVTQRRGNRNAIAAELLSERAFQKGIAERSFGVLGDSNALQDEKSTFNLSTALQDLGFLTESQRNLTTEYNKLLPVIGDVNDELLRLLSSIKDVNDALKKL